MNNTIIAVDKSNSFRVYLTVTTSQVETLRQIHETTPVSTAGLGRVFTGAGLMGVMMKSDKDKLTVQFKGDGPARQILATANGAGQVKGYISNPNVDLPLKDGALDVGGSLGIGDVIVIRDLGLKEPYMGTIALVSGEIAEDLAAYFYISEQQNTSVALGVKMDRDCRVSAAGGMIIQMLPDADSGAVDALEEMIRRMAPITTIIEGIAKESGFETEQEVVSAVLEVIFQNMPKEYRVKKLEERCISWFCDCSEERLEQVLSTVGREELKTIIEKDGEAEMQCQFCRKRYHFDQRQLEKILEVM